MEIEIGQSILAVNEKIAEENRRFFIDKNVFVINLMASPGAGKTSFIIKTIAEVKDRFRIGVIEGDIASQVDAEKVKGSGVAVVQINTGGACHLDAQMIKKTLSSFDLDHLDILIIENVGNLVCPADFELGESAKVVILSVPEGDDKPLKYPVMFTEADVLILNKVDLLGGSDFDLARFESSVRDLNPEVKLFKLSCKTGEGFDEWTDWLVNQLAGSSRCDLTAHCSLLSRRRDEMDRQEALDLVRENVTNKNLIKHMLAAEVVMRELARRFKEDEQLWGLAGLLHDVDYDQTFDKPEIHALVSEEILESKGTDSRIIDAVKAHADKAPRDSFVAKALYATDPLTGFLVDCALMTPDKKLVSVDVDFALRRFKEKAFAKGASREQMASCEGIGLTLEEFIGLGLKAMQTIATELGL